VLGECGKSTKADMNFYETLGIGASATPDEIKKAFRKKAKDNHPDREGGSDEAMSKINQAYGILSDPQKRSRYDETGLFNDLPNVTEQAESLIMHMFSRCLSSRISGSVVWQVKQGLFAEESALQNQLSQLTGQKDMLLARRKTVKSTSSKNLAHMVVDQQVQSIGQMIDQKKEQVEIFKKALELVQTYEDVEAE
jgi:curved DNA-binding protein CbpA